MNKTRNRPANKTTERREKLREALVRAAERTVKTKGLEGLKARDLAEEVGCSLGAIYTVFPDLDGLIFEVNGRTLVAVQKFVAQFKLPGDSSKLDPIVAHLLRLALAYTEFASANEPRWRALFEHRSWTEVRAWYVEAQKPLFSLLEEPLRDLLPKLGSDQRAVLARTLFAAVHGVISLGLDDKLFAIPPPLLRRQVRRLVIALGAGLRDDRAA
jgi:AcrR family transcriptional regulator